jgi:hypothetical protein
MREKALREPERLMTLDEKTQLALWFVPVELIREQDINARVMSNEKFDRLAENIKKDGVLESLPLCHLKANEAGNREFFLISGHHRTRAARKAGVLNIHVLVYEREMSRDEVISKQLSHNSLNGYDDKETLGVLYNEIKDLTFKIATGISDLDITIDSKGVQIDDIKVELNYEMLNILFLPKQMEYLEKIFALIEPEATVYLADKADFDKFAEQARTIAKRDNIINMSAIVARMLEIVELYHKEVPAPEKPEKKGKETKKPADKKK